MTFAQPFSNYEILARIGSGAMGTVFKARQKHMNRIVALKVLKPSLARDARYVERLQREARIVGKLNHPNIVTGYDLGNEGGYHFFVMEFVEGRSLRQLLQEWGMFPEEQVLDVAMRVADALAHAFECGVIHRDIKPGNILIDDDGRVKLTDMGLAKVESDLALTREGATVGTPQYISPEQARDPQRADIRSDLYSLGATLFHMATGQPPFRADSIGELITKVLHERPPSAVELNPELTDGLSLVIRKLLAKDPALRYQTPKELLVDLARVRRRERPDVDRGALEEDEAIESAPSAPRPERRVGRWGLTVALVAVAIVVAFVALRGDGGERDATGDVGRFRTELVEALARTDSYRARFEILRDRRAVTSERERVDVLDGEKRRLELELGRLLGDAISAFSGARREETERWLRQPEHWRDPGAFVRERVVPEVEQRFGYRPDELPTAELRRDASAQLVELAEELGQMSSQRDEEFLRRHARYLRDELREEVLALARRGELRDALEHLRDGLDAFFSTEGRPSRAQLSDVLRAKVIKAEEAAERSLEEEVRKAQDAFLRALRAEADAGFAALERLRMDLARTGGSPVLLREAADELDRRLARFHAGSTELIAGTPDPWPEIDARGRAVRAEIDVLQRRFERQVLDEGLDLAYRVLIEDGPAAAARVVQAQAPTDDEVAERQARHLAVLAAADELARATLEALAGARVPLTDGADGRVGRDGDRTVVRDAAGRAVPLARVELEQALQRLSPAARASIVADPEARAARALLMLARGDHAAATALVDGEDLELLESDVWPRIRSLAAQAGESPVESEARAAVDRLMRAREADDVDGVHRALTEFEARYADSSVATETARLRADAAEWLRGRRAEEEFERRVRERLPESFAVEFGDAGLVKASGFAGRLPEALRPPSWVAEGDALRWVASDGSAQPLDLALPILEPSTFRVAVELRLQDRGSEAQLVVVHVGGATFGIVVLPLGQLAAVLLSDESVTERMDELRRELAAPIADALEGPQLLVHGAWHRVTIRAERRRGGGLDAELWWDGPDGRQLASGRAPARAATSRLRVLPFHPVGVRQLEIECAR